MESVAQPAVKAVIMTAVVLSPEALALRESRKRMNPFVYLESILKDRELWPEYDLEGNSIALPKHCPSMYSLARDPLVESLKASSIDEIFYGGIEFREGDHLLTDDVRKVADEMHEFVAKDLAATRAKWNDLRKRFAVAIKDANDARAALLPDVVSFIKDQDDALNDVLKAISADKERVHRSGIKRRKAAQTELIEYAQYLAKPAVFHSIGDKNSNEM